MSDAYELMEHLSGDLGAYSTMSSLTQSALGESGSLEKAGKVADVAHAGVDLGLAADDFIKDGPHSDAMYDHLGGAALHTAGALLGPEGKALEAGEAAIDFVGGAAGEIFGKDAGFNADQVAGGMIRHTFGDESTGWAAGSAVSDALGGGALGTTAGVLAGSMAEGAALPFDAARAGIDGISHEASAIFGGEEKMTMDPSSGANIGQQLKQLKQKQAGDKAVHDVEAAVAVNNAILQANMLKFNTDKMLHDEQAKAHPAAAKAAAKPAHPKRHHRHHHKKG